MSEKVLDPHLAELLTKNQSLEKPFYEFLIENKLKEYIYGFSNTPTWVLTKLFNSLSKDDYTRNSLVHHPNFDSTVIEEIISENDTLLLSGVVHNPKLTTAQLTAISQNPDSNVAAWANYYLIRNANRIDQFIETQLSASPEERVFTLRTALRDDNLSDETVSLLAKHADEQISKYVGEKIGEVLSLNEHLSEESRTMLHLLGFSKKEATNQIPFYPSSAYITKKLEQESGLEDEVVKALFAAGHPLEIVSKKQVNSESLHNEVDIFQVFESELLHRAFWRELSDEVPNFRLNFRNGYRVQDLFVNHPTISHEFDGSDFDDGWMAGGVLKGYLDRSWVYKDSYISPYQISFLMNSADSESLDEMTEEQEQFSSVQPFVLAFLKDVEAGQELCAEYGIELTEKASEEIESAAYDMADSEDYDVDVDFSDSFDEFLTWKSLPVDQQDRIFKTLTVGLSCNSARVSKDSEHFLACIALHPATPTSIVKALEILDSSVVQSTLKLRSR